MRPEHFASRSTPDSSHERKAKLLLVDEHPQELHDYTAMLRYLGYEVHPAPSYREAVELLGREAFDLVLVDQGSADFEGRGVLCRAVEMEHRTPVLVLTGRADVHCCVDALNLGAEEYVQKPLTSSEVRELVEDYLSPAARFAAAGEGLLIPSQSAARESWRRAS